MVGVKEAEMLRFLSLLGHRTIRNPNALMVEIHLARALAASGFFGAGAGEERAMKKGHLHFSAVAGNRHPEKTGVLVVHMDEIDALIRCKGCQPQPLPMD